MCPSSGAHPFQFSGTLSDRRKYLLTRNRRKDTDRGSPMKSGMIGFPADSRFLVRHHATPLRHFFTMAVSMSE